eukprot:355651-Prorocentrum_minimum.AAC.12
MFVGLCTIPTQGIVNTPNSLAFRTSSAVRSLRTHRHELSSHLTANPRGGRYTCCSIPNPFTSRRSTQ